MAFTPRVETYVNVSSLSTPFDTSFTMPGSTANGDFMTVFLAWSGTVTIDSVPSGWTLVGQNIANTDRYALYFKIASSETGPYVFSFTATAKVRGVCSVYTAGDFNVLTGVTTSLIISNTSYRTNDGNVRAAEITGVAPNSPLLFFGAVYSLNATRSTAKPTTPTTGWVEDEDAWNTTSDFQYTICSYIWTGYGSTGDMDAILDASNTSTTKHAFAIALRPKVYLHDGALSDTGTYSSGMSFASGALPLDYTHQGNITKVQTANSYASSFTKIIGTLRQEETWSAQPIIFLSYTHQGTINSVGTYGSTKTVEVLKQGTLNDQEWLTSTKTVEALKQGTLNDQEWLSSNRYILKNFDGTLSEVDTYSSTVTFTAANVAYTHQGALSEEAWASSPRTIGKFVDGTLNTAETWDHTVTKTGAVAYLHDGAIAQTKTYLSAFPLYFIQRGAIAQTATLASDKTVGRLYQGSINQAETWSSPYAIAKNFAWDGAIAANEKWESIRGIAKVLDGTLNDQMTFAAIVGRESIVFGTLNKEHSFSSTVSKENVFIGNLSAAQSWAAVDRYQLHKFIWSGAITAAQTWASRRILNYTCIGGISKTHTWSSNLKKNTQVVYIGTLNGVRTWIHQSAIEHLIVGGITKEQWLREHTPFDELWVKDNGVDATWTKRSGLSDGWTKRSASSDTWQKRGPSI